MVQRVKPVSETKGALSLKFLASHWANVSSRTELEVFGEASWFLIGPTFFANLVGSIRRSYIRGPKTFAQHVLGTFALLDDYCL